MAEEKQQNNLDDFITHQRKAFEEAGKAFEALIPEGFKTHGREAFKEAVEGWRSLFNATVDAVQDMTGSDDATQDATTEKSTKGKTKVKVDLDDE